MWIAAIRKVSIKRLCRTELEAVAHYNAACKVLWPDRKLNDLTRIRLGNFMVGREYVIDLTGGRYARVDQEREAKYNYWNLQAIGWFYREGVVQMCRYTGEAGFQYCRLDELVFGGPCIHLDDNPLNCHRGNLGAIDKADPPAMPGLITVMEPLKGEAL